MSEADARLEQAIAKAAKDTECTWHPDDPESAARALWGSAEFRAAALAWAQTLDAAQSE